MTCPSCNFQNKPDARFCAECGFSFAIPSTSNPVIQPPFATSNPATQPPPIAASTAAPALPANFDVNNIKIPPRFFNFLKPYLNYIDKGSIFRRPFFWLYVAFSIVCLLMPLYGLYKIIDEDMLSYGYSFQIILAWLLIAFIFWLSFQMWWSRKDKIQTVSRQGDEFVAIPVFSYFIQHLGEWLSLVIALGGVGAGLLALLFSDRYNRNFLFLAERKPLEAIWMAPLAGFAVLILTRVVAEILRALTSIANNTKKL